MTSVKNVFLDIGDIYTKFHVLDEDNKLLYNVCFPTIAKKGDVSHETCSYFKDVESENYMMVGWDAAYELEYDDIVKLKFKASAFDIFNKILFEYIDDGSVVNINFIADKAHDDIQLEDAEKIYKDCEYSVEGFINGVYITKHYTINITSHMVTDILANYFAASTIQVDHDVVITIDIGFSRTKLFIIDTQDCNVVFDELHHGFDYYLMKLRDHFEDAGLCLHPFILLKELERNNAIIDTEDGAYDISKIIDNARFDLCKAIITETEEILKEFYNSFLVWPGFLYITGGGAILCGEAIKAELATRYDQFEKAYIVESKPRDYLVRTCLQLS